MHNEIFINTGLQPGAISKREKPFQRFYSKESR